ncbi:hypothetical protein CAPTEDRAFT_145629, partial [Capitella teleta]
DETLIFHCDFEHKRESMEWQHHRSSPPQSAKISRTIKNNHDASFLGFQRSDKRRLDYMEKGTTINGAYYAKLLEKVCVAIEKRHGSLAGGQRFQQGNLFLHNSHIAVPSGRKCGFENLSHLL